MPEPNDYRYDNVLQSALPTDSDLYDLDRRLVLSGKLIVEEQLMQHIQWLRDELRALNSSEVTPSTITELTDTLVEYIDAHRIQLEKVMGLLVSACDRVNYGGMILASRGGTPSSALVNAHTDIKSAIRTLVNIQADNLNKWRNENG